MHLRPTPFKKMRVKLATQVMSRSVAAAMVLYADLGKFYFSRTYDGHAIIEIVSLVHSLIAFLFVYVL